MESSEMTKNISKTPPSGSSSSPVVVTGAGRGIGRATAEAFARRGYDLVLVGRNAGELEAASASCAKEGVSVLEIDLDITTHGAAETIATRTLEHFGPPAVVVNNAGIVHRSLVEETDDASWNAVLDVNLHAPFRVCRAFLRANKKAGFGRFVQVASISSTLGTPRLASYCAAKWGIVGFTKSLAEELRGTGLAALAVLPGSVATRMLEGSGFPPMMEPSDVANTIVYAGLDAPLAMNGSAIEVFG